MQSERFYSAGPEFIESGVHFKVWAPASRKVEVIIQDKIGPFEMNDEPGGYKSLVIPSAKAGDLYWFKLDDGKTYPDPCSRAQPFGPHGPSQLVNSKTFLWNDYEWKGIQQKTNVIYEMHIGTFTDDGTFRAAARELAELARLGITIIELMPVNEFDGDFGWGYDGVDLYAPYHNYGAPDDLRFFIDNAHSVGLGVILDVVYNHIGASGCYLRQFSDDYISKRYKSEWGDTFNFDDENATATRNFIIENAAYWIREFHFDGFRFDATQQIFDQSGEHIINAIVNAAKKSAKHKQLFIAGENEPQRVEFVKSPNQNGYGFDALWNDDFHHSAVVAATGRNAAYFTDYHGDPQELVANMKYSFLYQGQYYHWQNQRRGTPTFGLSANSFIHYLQNHDQIANGGRGKRLHQLSNPALMRALTTLLLLGPQTPLLFQGQEFGASSPFLYFADNPESLRDAVAQGRNEFLHQFPYLALPQMQPYLSVPHDPATFHVCKLRFSEREHHNEIYQLHYDLLKLRHNDSVFSGLHFDHLDGSIIAGSLMVLRFFSTLENNDRLIIVNFARDFLLAPVPEPLLAPHANNDWKLLWSSEAPQYGGHGGPAPFTPAKWLIPGLSAIVLTPAQD